MIINFLIDKILIDKKNDVKGKVEAKNNVKIQDITQESASPLQEKQQKVLKFKYVFTVKYEPKIADVEITGSILFLADDATVKSVLDEWKKDKKIKPAISFAIINYVLNKCNIKTLTLTQDLGLPPHIPFPVVASKSVLANQAS